MLVRSTYLAVLFWNDNIFSTAQFNDEESAKNWGRQQVESSFLCNDCKVIEISLEDQVEFRGVYACHYIYRHSIQSTHLFLSLDEAIISGKEAMIADSECIGFKVQKS